MKTVFFASPLGCKFVTNRSCPLVFRDWLEQMIMQKGIEVLELILAICYEVRKVRNKRCFEGQGLPTTMTCFTTALNSILNFNNASVLLDHTCSSPTQVPISNVHWSTPINGGYKLNADVAGPDNEGRWGMADIVRDSDEYVVGVVCWCLPLLPNSDIAEYMAMLKGL